MNRFAGQKQRHRCREQTYGHQGGKAAGGGGGGVMNWAIGTDMYTLMCIKWMTNKNLQYKKINKILKKKKIFIFSSKYSTIMKHIAKRIYQSYIHKCTNITLMVCIIPFIEALICQVLHKEHYIHDIFISLIFYFTEETHDYRQTLCWLYLVTIPPNSLQRRMSLLPQLV